jgi:hypothetical protein
MDHILNVPTPGVRPRRHIMPLRPGLSKRFAGTSTSSVRTVDPFTTPLGLSLSKPLTGTSTGTVRTVTPCPSPKSTLRRYRAMEHAA